MAYDTKFHADNTVTVWDTYQQRWVKTYQGYLPEDRVLAAMCSNERDQVIEHCQVKF